MKALVIGATGMIGNHIVRALLAEGIEVRAFSRGVTSSINLEGLDVEFIRGDLEIKEDVSRAVKGCSWVFHAASYYPTHTFHLSEHKARAKRGIDSVLNGVSDHSIERFVYTSSLTTIGKSASSAKLADESCRYDLIYNPPHPYFAVKFLMEETVRERLKDIPAVIVNPTGCFGPYDLKPLKFSMVGQLVEGKVPAYVDCPINVVDVSDVARGHFLAANRGEIGSRYILGGPHVTSEWIVFKICDLAGVRRPRFKVPLKLALAVSWASEFLAHFVFKRIPSFPILGLRFLQYGLHYNLSKAQTELGYSISPMENCLVQAIEWHKKIK